MGSLSVDHQNHYLNHENGSLSIFHLKSWHGTASLLSIKLFFGSDHDVPEDIIDKRDNSVTVCGKLTPELQNQLIASRSASIEKLKALSSLETLKKLNETLMIANSLGDQHKQSFLHLISDIKKLFDSNKDFAAVDGAFNNFKNGLNNNVPPQNHFKF